jgi:hypothetical protein
MLFNPQNVIKAQKIKTKCFEGYIFSKNYNGILPLGNFKRFTPSESDVENAEKILKKQIRSLNVDLLNQVDGCPVIHKKLTKYKRQYVGIINQNGDMVVWVNFIWAKDKDSIKKLGDEIIIILDGCSYYWNVKVNLSSENLFDLSINGPA